MLREELGLTQEQIDSSRRYYAELTGEKFEDVPWQVIFIDDRPLTKAEMERGRELAAEMKRDLEFDSRPGVRQ